MKFSSNKFIQTIFYDFLLFLFCLPLSGLTLLAETTENNTGYLRVTTAWEERLGGQIETENVVESMLELIPQLSGHLTLSNWTYESPSGMTGDFTNVRAGIKKKWDEAQKLYMFFENQSDETGLDLSYLDQQLSWKWKWNLIYQMPWNDSSGTRRRFARYDRFTWIGEKNLESWKFLFDLEASRYHLRNEEDYNTSDHYLSVIFSKDWTVQDHFFELSYTWERILVQNVSPPIPLPEQLNHLLDLVWEYEWTGFEEKGYQISSVVELNHTRYAIQETTETWLQIEPHFNPTPNQEYWLTYKYLHSQESDVWGLEHEWHLSGKWHF
ncbi:MAG: hypothetical protein HQM11_17755 [SAR324 cluster bacterium]|nr:hypothetical protein [SAR324 cluster bacterium]